MDHVQTGLHRKRSIFEKCRLGGTPQITINFDCFHLFQFFCFSATNKVAASLIHKCRPFLGHLNLRGCYNLSSVSLKLTGKLC